jgi:lysyl-tRNA synthetase class I
MNDKLKIVALSKNLEFFEQMVAKRFDNNVIQDFRENRHELMTLFSNFFAIFESESVLMEVSSNINNYTQEDLEKIAAISAVTSYMYSRSTTDFEKLNKIFEDKYENNVFSPVNSKVFKIFYDYIRLVLKESKRHNKRLKIN